MAIVECNECTKKYDNKVVISNFSYNFDNHIYFLKGKNGSGKSTLLRMITQIEKPTAGTIVNHTKNILFLSNEGIGQNFLTIQENIELSFAIHNILLDEEIQSNIDKLYSNEQLHTLYEQASLGMSLKVGCSLLFKEHHWDLIILDETLSNIDQESREIILAKIEQLVKKDKVCVIVTSHNQILADCNSDYKTITL